jgi:uncharacterized membrane protein YeaQ/YmgE (transglycosylase-associated protein family)
VVGGTPGIRCERRAIPHIDVESWRRRGEVLMVSPHHEHKENAMSILAWIVLGLMAGYLGSVLVNKHGEGAFFDIVLGVLGAVVGGLLFNLVGAVGITGFNVWSLFVSVIGAAVLLVAYHAVRRTHV